MILTNVLARVNIRRSYKGRPRKDGCEKYQGKIYEFYFGWLMQQDEKYPGEWAMIAEDDDFRKIFPWIASGDLEIL